MKSKNKVELLNMYDASGETSYDDADIATEGTSKTAQLGQASFNEEDFDVVNGFVSLKYDYAKNTVTFVLQDEDSNYPGYSIYKAYWDDDDVTFDVVDGYNYNFVFDKPNISKVLLFLGNDYYSLYDADGVDIPGYGLKANSVYHITCKEVGKSFAFYIGAQIVGPRGEAALAYTSIVNVNDTDEDGEDDELDVGNKFVLSKQSFNRNMNEGEVFTFTAIHTAIDNETKLTYTKTYSCMGKVITVKDGNDDVTVEILSRTDITGVKSTVAIGKTTILDPSSTPAVENVGDVNDAVLEFSLPTSTNVTIAEMTDENILEPGVSPYVTTEISGDNNQNVQLTFNIPTSKEIEVGTVTQLIAGESPTVTDSGTAYKTILDFGIPAGEASLMYSEYITADSDTIKGTTYELSTDFFNRTPIVDELGLCIILKYLTPDDPISYLCTFKVTAVGSVTTNIEITVAQQISHNITVSGTNTLAAGKKASVINEGTGLNPVLAFNIPKGLPGNVGQDVILSTAIAPTSGGTYEAPAESFVDGYFALLEVGQSYPVFVNYNDGEECYLCTTKITAKSDTTVTFTYLSVLAIKGEPASVDVGDVTTIDPYDADGNLNSVVVTNVGTTKNAVFNFQIPRGEPGKPFNIKGILSSVDDLPDVGTTLDDNEAYLVGSSSPYTLYVQIDNAWTNAGTITEAKGDKGEQGEAATIAVGTVSTLEAGNSATVTNSGTSTNAILDFGIPKGEKGNTGNRGSLFFKATSDADSTTTYINISDIDVGDETLQVGDMLYTPDSNIFRITQLTTVNDVDVAYVQYVTNTKGDTGETGAQGVQGEAGTAATISIGTVTTGEAGSSASVTNSGTENAAVFDFVIPKGDTGAKGDSGLITTYAQFPYFTLNIYLTSDYDPDDSYDFSLYYIDIYGNCIKTSITLTAGQSRSFTMYKLLYYVGGDVASASKTGTGIIVYNQYKSMSDTGSVAWSWNNLSSTVEPYGIYAVTSGADVTFTEAP